ncbi:MAG: carboxylating nicotinate-nucleotide diphosphorylase [Candidatus Omnitrophota bacterium]|nr:carboxylating nicotinate-nucleotide diphosphorylase [Candidatus Omnitrophota bacterium]
MLPIIKSALKEDIGKGDITTGALIDKRDSSGAAIVTNGTCVVCGLEVAEWIMAEVDSSARFKPDCKDAVFAGAGKEIAFIEGRTTSILRAERTMLNFLSFLSGIATTTRQFVDKAKPYGVKIMDTRKTLPLLRYLEKYAVSAGGGSNHRMGLYDRILIKDNHISVQRNKKIAIQDIVERCRKKAAKGAVIEVEVSSIAEFSDALLGKPDIVMLDNMRAGDVLACVEIRRFSKQKPLLEVSGGITIGNVEEYARTKVDMISIGSLTISVKSIDMSLELVS